MSEPIAVVERLGYRFAGRTEATLRDVSLAIAPGSWTVVAGRTGSGKSTLLRALAGLIPHLSAGELTGRVLVSGLDTRSATPGTLASRVGLVLQSPDDQICTTTVAAEVAFGLENLAVAPDEIGRRIPAALARAGLHGLAARATHTLSGGQKQRLVLASIMAMRPRLVLLDEPLSQLDAAGASELLADLVALRDAGVAIVIAEHRLDDVLAPADRLVVLDEGRLVADVAADETAEVAGALERGGLRLRSLPGAVVHARAERGQAHFSDVANSQASANRPKNEPVPAPRERFPRGETILEARQLGFRFPKAPSPVWQDVSFAIRRGERVAVVGPNGSGKSTLLAVLAELLPASAGSLVEPSGDGRPASRAIVLQNPDLMLFCPTVRDELAFGPRQSGHAPAEVDGRVSRAAAALDLEALLDEPPLALSQGQRLRVAVAATLALAPRLLLLDEPTTGQDAAQVERIMQSLSAQVAAPHQPDESDGREAPCAPEALIFSTHDLRCVLDHADRVLVIAQGRLLADATPAELVADEVLLRTACLRYASRAIAAHNRINCQTASQATEAAEVGREGRS